MIFLLIYPKLIHHEKTDNTFDQKSFSLFLHTLLQLVRQCIPSPEKSTLLFRDQILQLIRKSDDKTSSLFYLMKIFEFLLNKDIHSSLSNLFKQVDKHWLYTCLQNITKKLPN
jgi:hypothetical protein